MPLMSERSAPEERAKRPSAPSQGWEKQSIFSGQGAQLPFNDLPGGRWAWLGDFPRHRFFLQEGRKPELPTCFSSGIQFFPVSRPPGSHWGGCEWLTSFLGLLPVQSFPSEYQIFLFPLPNL